MLILIKNLKKGGKRNNLGQTITILLFLLHVTYILCFKYQIIHHVHTYYYNSSNIKTESYLPRIKIESNASQLHANGLEAVHSVSAKM